MPTLILPLRAFVFQAVLLLMTIAIEATVLHKQLDISRQTSVQYATTLNLLSTLMGWIGFLLLQPRIPEEWRTQLISYILFTRLMLNETLMTTVVFISMMGVMAFFLTLILEVQALTYLKILLSDQSSVDSRQPKMYRYRNSLLRRQPLEDNTELKVILVANACSYSAVLLLLAPQLLTQFG